MACLIARLESRHTHRARLSTRQPLMSAYTAIIYKQILKVERVYDNNLQTNAEGNYHVQRC